MSYEFKLPDIGEGVTEGEIVKWLVQKGDQVQEDQPILEIMTDKATVEIASPVAGQISDLKANEGESVKVGGTLVMIDQGGSGNGTSATANTQKAQQPQASAQPSSSTQAQSNPNSRSQTTAAQNHTPQPLSPKTNGYNNGQTYDVSRDGPILASPATRKFAREQGIDLASVQGTGEHGRVLMEDVQNSSSSGAATAQRQAAAQHTQQTSTNPPTPSKQSPAATYTPPSRTFAPGSEERIPLRGIRKKIAENMLQSKLKAAHFSHMDDMNASRLVEARENLKPYAQEKGIKLTYLPFIVKAVSAALKDYPKINSALDEEKQEIVVKHYFNIGIAVATADDDLIVPVIKNADQKSLLEIAYEIDSLAQKARTNKLSPSDLSGGTFTITSLGTLAGLYATPVINYPEVGILGFYRIEDKPHVEDGKIVVQKRATASITLNHRLVDGALGAKFMKAFISYIEEPMKLLLG